MVTITAKSSVDCALIVDGDFDYGEVGDKIEDSRYFRAYCYLCDEPIRVQVNMIGYPNACSVCRPAYRGTPGVTLAERNFWLEQYYIDEAEVISG